MQENKRIVIIGAGVAGISAAIRFARLGIEPILIDLNNSIGGISINAEVGTICGIYKNTQAETFSYCSSNFLHEIGEKLRLEFGSKPVQNKQGLKFLPYKIVDLDIVLNNLIKQEKIDLRLGHKIEEVNYVDTNIESVILSNKIASFSIKVEYLIDCSGRASLKTLLKHPVIQDNNKQGVAQIINFELNTKQSSEEQLNLLLMVFLKRNERELAYIQSLSVVPSSFCDNKVALKIAFKYNFTNSHQEQLKLKINQEVRHLLELLLKQRGILSKLKFISTAKTPGVRVQDRYMGKVVLKKENVVNADKFELSMANGTWPMEFWDIDNGLKLTHLKQNDYYQVPLGALSSNLFENLFFAGRNISADQDAIASARVMGTCIQMGYNLASFIALHKLNKID